MEFIDLLMVGLSTALTPQNLFAVFCGSVIGTVVGGFPGLSAPTAIALLLPVTFSMEPTTGLIMLAGIYYGSQFGNSITAILLGIPGDSAAVVTSIEGHRLLKKGKAGYAFTVAAAASCSAGLVGTLAVALVGPPLAWIGLKFGDPEYVALILLAFCTLPAFSAGSTAKVIMAVALGILLTTVGMDFASGLPRFVFGQTSLMDGIPLVPAIIGLFGIADVIHIVRTEQKKAEHVTLRMRDLLPPLSIWTKVRMTILRSSLLGFVLGILPGAGATIANFLAYGLDRGLARDKSEYGHGSINGMAASEAGSNGAAVGSLLPMLTLGIPGSASTAVLLGGFLIWGIQPGPMLFEHQPTLVWGLIVSMLIGNIMLLIMNIGLVPWFARIAQVPLIVLAPLIVVFCTAGAYANSNSGTDVMVMFAFGILGYIFVLLNIPAVALLLGLILGGTLEEHLRRMIMANDDGILALVNRPIPLTILVMCVLLLVVPHLMRMHRNRAAFA